MEQASGEPDGVEDRRGDSSPREPLDLAIEEPDVETGVVRDERHVACECEKSADGELGSGSCSKVVSANPGQRRDVRGYDDPGIDERLEGVVQGERANASSTDLA